MLVVGSPISLAAIAWRLARSLDAGVAATVAGVVIDRDGTLRQSATRWRIGDELPFELDATGLPVFDDEVKQPLEVD